MAKTPTPNDANDPQPTEQLPVESAPVSATSAASGGATGLEDEKPTQPSVFRRHPLATGIAAAAIAVVLVSGLTAWAVGAAVTASLTSSASSEMPMAMPTTAPTAGGTGTGTGGTAGAGGSTTGRLAFRATIQSMDGSAWSILTKKGTTVTVMVDSATQFGTKKAAATEGSFAVGDSVIVVAMRGTTAMPTATRIVKSPTGS